MPLHANGTYTVSKAQQEQLGRVLGSIKPPTLRRQIAANGLFKGFWRYINSIYITKS
jgi:hypothetical protein